MNEPVEIDFYFNVFCPWTWRTALWMRHVQAQRPIAITWKVLSLAVLNKDKPNRHGDALALSYRADVLFETALVCGGNAAVEALYLAMGDARHGRGADANEKLLSDALDSARLPADWLLKSRSDPAHEQRMLENHRRFIEELQPIGVPTLHLKGASSGFFGPVIDPMPEGQEALDLWDHLLWSLTRPYFWELRRPRTHRPGPQPSA